MSVATSTAIAIGGVAAAGASVAGGLLSKSGADSAANATLQASTQANAEAKREFDTSQKNLAPWLGSGSAAAGRLSYLLGLNPVIGDSTASFNQNFGPMGAPPSSSTLTPAQRLQTLSGGSTRGGGVQNRPGGALTTGIQGNFRETPIERNGGPAIGTPPFVATPGAPPTVGSAGGLVPSSAPTTTSSTTGGPTDPNSYGSLMHDFSAADFQADPGYAFRLSEGQKALERSAAARGVLGSGTFLKDLTDYNSGEASQEYGNAYNRFQNNRTTRYNFLAGPAGYGLQTAQTLGTLGAQYAGQYGANLMSGAENAANLRASGYNALAGSVASAIPTGIGAYDYLKYGPPPPHN